MNKIYHFFWFCSGAYVDALVKTPTEQHKYAGIGATIFFTGLFAAIAGAYAMYFVFNGSPLAWLTAILFGIIWGVAIFNMDRYIVSTINKKNTVFKQLLQASPRLLLAVLIGVVISRPLEMKVFEKEIKEQLKLNYLAVQRAKIDTLGHTFDSKYNTEITKLALWRAERDSLVTDLKKDRQSLNYEIFGNKTQETSGIMGYGPYAKRKEAALSNREALEKQLLQRIEQQERFLKERKEFEGLFDERLMTAKELDSMVNLAGFADRNTALGQLKYDKDGKVNESNYWAITFIALLFVFFECLPVLVKLMSGKGPYDDLIGDAEEVTIYQSQKDKEASMIVIDGIQEEKISIQQQRALQKIKEGLTY